jgi:acyl CoA:acetate/3-ketoacid CoA transferase
MIDQPPVPIFYDGGGLDVALSCRLRKSMPRAMSRQPFRRQDHRRAVINISQNARAMVFSGTLKGELISPGKKRADHSQGRQAPQVCAQARADLP